MTEDFAPIQVATDYMAVAETMMILTPLRYFWDNRKEVLKDLLLIKDGPLSLRATLSKLSIPIRKFLNHAQLNGYNIHIIGQEKTGLFFDHLQLIGKAHLIIPSSIQAMNISMMKFNTLILKEFMVKILIMEQRFLLR